MKEVKFKDIDLSHVFYVPREEVFRLVVGLCSKERERDFYRKDVSTYSKPEAIAGVIVQLFYAKYCEDFPQYKGSMNMEDLIKNIKLAILSIKQEEFFGFPSHYFNMRDKKEILDKLNIVECTSNEENLFAIGRFNGSFEDSDNDCYETAGGYRTWKSDEGAICKFYLDHKNEIYVSYDSNCVVDHYNNNFFGVSTGNGTTKYEAGERVEKRTRRLEGKLFSEILKSKEFDIKKADFDKAKNICNKNISKF